LSKRIIFLKGKRFQNVAKEGVQLDKSKSAEERVKEIEKNYEPLIKWIKDKGLKDKVESVKISSRLVETPMALVANQFGYSGNMERIAKAQAYQKTGGDSMSNYYFGQKKILEINPGHPLIKELLKRVEDDAEDSNALDSVELMFEAATMRSGFDISNSKDFAERIERMLRRTLNVSLNEKVEEEPDYEDEPEPVKDETKPEEAEETVAEVPVSRVAFVVVAVMFTEPLASCMHI
jgi:heat shock protein beta